MIPVLEVEREFWMNDTVYRSYQLDGQPYQLWHCEVNQYHDGCYVLHYAVSDGKRKITGWTYFYVNPPTEHDMTLEQAVNSVLANL